MLSQAQRKCEDLEAASVIRPANMTGTCQEEPQMCVCMYVYIYRYIDVLSQAQRKCDDLEAASVTRPAKITETCQG